MQSKNPRLNDLSKLVTGAFGIAQNARAEMETVVSSVIERWLSDRDLVTREEFDAVRIMAQKNAKLNQELFKKILDLETKIKTSRPKIAKNAIVKKS